MYTSWVCQPVMSMNNIKLLSASYYTGNDGIVVDFLMQVRRITTGKFHTAKVIDMHIVEVGIDMVAQTIVVVGIHNIGYAALYIIVVDITPCYRHTIHSNNTASAAILVTKRVRQAQYCLYIALGMKSL